MEDRMVACQRAASKTMKQIITKIHSSATFGLRIPGAVKADWKLCFQRIFSTAILCSSYTDVHIHPFVQIGLNIFCKCGDWSLCTMCNRETIREPCQVRENQSDLAGFHIVSFHGIKQLSFSWISNDELLWKENEYNQFAVHGRLICSFRCYRFCRFKLVFTTKQQGQQRGKEIIARLSWIVINPYRTKLFLTFKITHFFLMLRIIALYEIFFYLSNLYFLQIPL